MYQEQIHVKCTRAIESVIQDIFVKLDIFALGDNYVK